MSSEDPRHPPGKHRYRSVVEGMALANEFARSRQSISEFARQRGVSFNMVKYWSTRARRLAAASASDLVQVAQVTPSGDVERVATSEPAVRQPEAPVPPAPPRLPAPVAVPPPSSPTIEVRLPNGVSIGIGAGFSPQVLAQVIACVGGRPC